MKIKALSGAAGVLLLACAPVAVANAADTSNYQTQSGKVLCAVTPNSSLVGLGPDAVVCQGEFSVAPTNYNSAVTTGNGSFRWEQGNIAVDDPTTFMTYGSTYHRGGWTIYHDSSGTRFTLDKTGHGMFVSIDDVHPF